MQAVIELPIAEQAAPLDTTPASQVALRGLYDIEAHLAALADSTELVEPDQEQQFLVDFQQALLAAEDKRDRVGHFFAHCDGAIALADQEIARLQKRKSLFQRAVEKMESYVTMAIKSQGLDGKGKWKKLEGKTSCFSLRRNPPTVSLVDEAAVPARFKSVTVTLPAELWEAMLDELDLEFRGRIIDAVKRPDSAVSKTAVKAAIEEALPGWKKLLESQPSVFAETVPGAAIAAGVLRLVRE